MMKLKTNVDKKVLFAIASIIACSAVAGSLDPDQQDWYKKYSKQKNVPAPEKMLINTDPEPDLSSGFTPLFNGKDLTGWTPKGGTSTFEVKEGVIAGTVVKGSASTYLCTDKADYTDFIFTCDMKWISDINSGIMFRASCDEKNVQGPQVEMEELEKGRGWSGGIYGQSCGGWFYPLWLEEHKNLHTAVKKDDWNRLTIMVKGNVVKTWINGLPAAHWLDAGSYPKGFFGLQLHKASSGEVHWKNIRVKELK